MPDISSAPQPTVSPTGGWADGGPLPIPPDQTVRAIPEQVNPVRITYSTPPQLTANDLERIRQGRLRPADKSSRAIRVALDNIAADTDTATTRAVAWQERERALLRDGGAIADIHSARAKASDVLVELEQLAAMTGSLRDSLARAEAEERAELDALAAQVPAAMEKVEAWRKWVTTEYPKLAQKIAAGLALEQPAEAAMQTLKQGAGRIPGVTVPAPLPLPAWGQQREPFRIRASLPGTDVQPRARWEMPLAAVQS